MKKYTELNENIEYTEKAKRYIKLNWSKEQVEYHIGSPDQTIEDMGVTNKLDRALELLQEYKNKWNTDVCIFESRTRILSEEEINTLLNSKKYNL